MRQERHRVRSGRLSNGRLLCPLPLEAGCITLLAHQCVLIKLCVQIFYWGFIIEVWLIERWPWDWTLSGRSLDWYQVAQSLHSNHMADLSTIGSAQSWNYLGYLSISKIFLSLGKFQGFREVLSQGAETKASQNLYYRTPTLNGTRWGGGKEFWEPKFRLS